MDARRFDALTRSLHSRRRIVQTLLGLGGGLGLGGSAILTEVMDGLAMQGLEHARHRHRHHHHRPRCLAVGATCVPTTPTKPTRCCSGQCGCVGTACTCRNAMCSTTCDTIADCCQGQCAAGISMCF